MFEQKINLIEQLLIPLFLETINVFISQSCFKGKINNIPSFNRVIYVMKSQQKTNSQKMLPLQVKKDISILAISDTHNSLTIQEIQSLPHADIMIHAGDFTMESSDQELQDFREILNQFPNIQKVVIPGNHQYIFRPDTAFDNEEQRRELEKVSHFLQFDLVIVKGIRILGINRWPEYFDMYFDWIPHLGKEIIDQYKEKVDILVTHWPPYGILDTVFKKDRGGSKGILKFVREIKPKIHIFGHIHEGYGQTEINGTHFYNVSYLDRQYKTKNKPFLITLPVVEEEKQSKQ